MAVLFTITYQPAGGDLMTLADVAAGQLPHIHRWPGVAAEDVVHMFGQESPMRLMLGNIAGDFEFTAEQSLASYGAMLTYFIAQRAQLGTLGVLTVTMQDVVAVMQNASFRSLEPTGFNGVRWPLKYVFGVSLIDPPATD